MCKIPVLLDCSKASQNKGKGFPKKREVLPIFGEVVFPCSGCGVPLLGVRCSPTRGAVFPCSGCGVPLLWGVDSPTLGCGLPYFGVRGLLAKEV